MLEILRCYKELATLIKSTEGDIVLVLSPSIKLFRRPSTRGP